MEQAGGVCSIRVCLPNLAFAGINSRVKNVYEIGRSAIALETKLTILYLVRPAEGGIKSHILTLLSGISSPVFRPILVCPSDCSLFSEAQNKGIEVIPMELPGDFSPVKDFWAVLNLRRILRRVKPDILHIHSAKAGLIGRSAVMPMRTRPKIVLTLHSFVFDERVGTRKRGIVRRIERSLAGSTDRFIAVSRALKDQLVSEMGLDSDKIAVIHNGIQFSEVLPKPKTETALIGTVSRLAPQKGVDCFLQAAALVKKKFPEARFAVVGDGPFRESLEKLAGELGVGVEFMGFRSDALSIVRSFDVFVLASTWETFGLTVVEAMSQRVPVVASRVGGIPEIIDGSTTGLLAEPGNAEDFAVKICSLLEDEESASRMALAGREFAAANFNSDRMVSETQALYQGLFSGDKNG